MKRQGILEEEIQQIEEHKAKEWWYNPSKIHTLRNVLFGWTCKDEE